MLSVCSPVFLKIPKPVRSENTDVYFPDVDYTFMTSYVDASWILTQFGALWPQLLLRASKCQFIEKGLIKSYARTVHRTGG